jgi:hypothetical protein
MSSISIWAKKVFYVPKAPFVEKELWFKIRPIQEFLEKNAQIKYKKLENEVNFDVSEFFIAPKYTKKGYFKELFVLSIYQGIVQGKKGYVLIDDQMIKELVWDQRFSYTYLPDVFKIDEKNIQKIPGRVAVISQFGYDNYFHWINEVLGRLALLEMHNIEYDWLYVADEKKYAKETLDLWGIDSSKIISPKDNNFCIQADELIVPSLVSNVSIGSDHAHAGGFINPITMKYVRNKLLLAAQKKDINSSSFAKKIFISRKDTHRRILNEDEIFDLFQEKGFVRYELSKMSAAEQIMLFHNAEIIIAEHGAGITNILFAKPNTKFFEIFQALVDSCFWWQSTIAGLQYFPCLTVPVDLDYFVSRKLDQRIYSKASRSRINISIQLIEKIIENL